ncbi:hypothetical protein [Coxiella endosymbiont of Amblyomma sculptum]|uniref:hypothetical protein n=1 Tax=Coxiella endosymbiont of Amblyomma sculptum TaxID=2487929 RepID=UPI001FECD95C|nr:hypothetical protein [Coxiella endosymbiont of Amblyomma sculptum]
MVFDDLLYDDPPLCCWDSEMIVSFLSLLFPNNFLGRKLLYGIICDFIRVSITIKLLHRVSKDRNQDNPVKKVIPVMKEEIKINEVPVLLQTDSKVFAKIVPSTPPESKERRGDR